MMCMRNEEDRYLMRSLVWNMRFLDSMFVYDDQSTDDSRKIAWRLGAHVEYRPNDVPSFMEDESKFRQAALESFEATFEPNSEDVVVALDADEFLVHSVDQNLMRPCLFDMDGEDMKVVEVFEVRNGTPLQRVDGYWGDIMARRVYRHQPGGVIMKGLKGCGSIPTYVPRRPLMHEAVLLHYGYAKRADQQAKFDRYNGLSGHGSNHVMSILKQPNLIPWDGVHPNV